MYGQRNIFLDIRHLNLFTVDDLDKFLWIVFKYNMLIWYLKWLLLKQDVFWWWNVWTLNDITWFIYKYNLLNGLFNYWRLKLTVKTLMLLLLLALFFLLFKWIFKLFSIWSSISFKFQRIWESITFNALCSWFFKISLNFVCGRFAIFKCLLTWRHWAGNTLITHLFYFSIIQIILKINYKT